MHETISDSELLARIDERTDRIEKQLVTLNGRVTLAETNISSIRERMAYWVGGIAAFTFIAGLVTRLFR